MSKKQLNPIEQRQCAEKINAKLATMTLSWTNEMKEWHPLAMQALQFGTVASLQTTSRNYFWLLQTDTHGVNANVVALLCNNMETVSPAQMGVSCERFSEILNLNQTIADHWETFVGPVRNAIIEEFESKPIIHTMNSKSN